MRIPSELELAGVIHDAADCANDDRENRCSWTMANAAAKAVHEMLAREAERAPLREVLIKLSNEAMGWSEAQLAEVGGWTNARCLLLRAKEAREALTSTHGTET